MTNRETTWMTIREAALALAVSELTVRRRIKDGRLRHQLINGKYYVDLSSSSDQQGSGEDAPEHFRQSDGQDSGLVPTMITHDRRRLAETPAPDRSGIAAHAEISAGNGREQPLGFTPPAPAIDLDAVLAELARLAEIAGRAGLLQEQYSELAARHEALQAGMLSLAGRNGWLESKLEERESELKLLTDQQPRPPWWKRLFGL